MSKRTKTTGSKHNSRKDERTKVRDGSVVVTDTRKEETIDYVLYQIKAFSNMNKPIPERLLNIKREYDRDNKKIENKSKILNTEKRISEQMDRKIDKYFNSKTIDALTVKMIYKISKCSKQDAVLLFGERDMIGKTEIAKFFRRVVINNLFNTTVI